MNSAHSAGLLAEPSCGLWSCASYVETVEPIARVERVEFRSTSLQERPALIHAVEAAPAQGADEPENAPVRRPPRPLVDDGKLYAAGPDPALRFVRYLDGQASLNSGCAIRGGDKLSRKAPPVCVNGRPIGFC